MHIYVCVCNKKTFHRERKDKRSSKINEIIREEKRKKNYECSSLRSAIELSLLYIKKERKRNEWDIREKR